MLRSVALSKAGILNPKNVFLGQFPRKLKAARILFSEECNEPIQCPDPCKGPCLMDQMPVPSGSWQKKFDDKLNESTRVLILGGGFFLATIFAVRILECGKLDMFADTMYLYFKRVKQQLKNRAHT